MKFKLLILSLVGLGVTLSAQENTIGVREANDPSGKILTMEETILSRELSPKSLRCRWNGDKDILMFKDGKTISFNIETRVESPYRAPRKKERIYTEGKSIYHNPGKGMKIAVAVSKDSSITYGQTVSRNEFGIEAGMFWSPDSSKVASDTGPIDMTSYLPVPAILTSRPPTERSTSFPAAT